MKTSIAEVSSVIHLLFLLELTLMRLPNWTSKKRHQSSSVSCPHGESQEGFCETVFHQNHRKSCFKHSQRCEPGTQIWLCLNRCSTWGGSHYECRRELKSAGLSASLALRLNLWPITHCAEAIRQERTLPLALSGQFAWRLRRCSEWADAFWEAIKK